jgi:hypothetical protein
MSNFLIKKGCKEMALNQDSSASGIQQWTGSQDWQPELVSIYSAFQQVGGAR